MSGLPKPFYEDGSVTIYPPRAVGEELDREQTEARLDELLALELAA